MQFYAFISRNFAKAVSFAAVAISFAASAVTINPGAYAHSFTVSFSGYAGTETLTDFPALVKISEATVPGFKYSYCASGGADLRFTDAEGNLLSSEVDTWDETGVSYVWVKIPSFDATTRITAHYGNASPEAVDPKDVWSNGYVGVWHLGAGGDQPDSKGECPDFRIGSKAPSVTLEVSGAIGCGIDFLGNPDPEKTGSGIFATNSPAFSGHGAFTFELWAKRHENGDGGELFCLDNVCRAIQNDTGVTQFAPVLGEDPEKDRKWVVMKGVAASQWYHLAMTYDRTAANRWTVDNPATTNYNVGVIGYADGVNNQRENSDVKGYFADGETPNPPLATSLPEEGHYAGLGNPATSRYNLFLGAGGHWWKGYSGVIDEFRISSVARSADWIRATRDNVLEENFAVFDDTSAGQGGWTGYSRSFSISFPNYSGEETLENFPVPVRISPAKIIGFDYGDLKLPCGGDLRFSDSDGNLLASEIETWNEDGESMVWVSVPRFASGTKITAYYGNLHPHAVDPRDVWTNGFAAVWHMDGKLPIKDSTGTFASLGINGMRDSKSDAEYWEINEFGVSGIAGEAVDFHGNERVAFTDGNTARASTGIVTENGKCLPSLGSKFTIELWSSQTETSNDHNGYMINAGYRDDPAPSLTQGPFRIWERGGYARFYMWFYDPDADEVKQAWANDFTGLPLAMDGTWNHIALKGDLATGPEAQSTRRDIHAYLNGEHTGHYERWATKYDSKCSLVAGNTAFQVGSAWNVWAREGFPGKLDEIRISTVVRSDAWLKTTYALIADVDSAKYQGVKQPGFILIVR